MIYVDNVYKRFGQQVVLDGVSLRVAPQSTTAVVGPSGVGKSVLLKLILGIMQPDSGTVEVCGEMMTSARSEGKRNQIRSKLGVLFQSAALFDSLSIFDNIAFPLRFRTGLPEAEVFSKVEAMLDALSLHRYAFRYPEEISLGIRKRVGMARALIMEPEVFLLDEPNTGLDPLDGQEVYDLIKECRKNWKFAALVISHEIPEVFQVSDRVAMLLNGKFVMEGTPEEISASSDVAVQQFINGRTDGPIRIS